jgi:acyl dehydratase
MTTTAKLFWEDVQVGQEVAAFQRETDLMNWNRWASVNDEFVPFHMDDDAARGNGQPAAFGQGPMRFSYLHSMLREWIGDDGEVARVKVQMRGINFKHDVLTCSGKVTGKRVENGQHLVDLEVSITNQRGEVVTPGEATVRLPSRGR